MNITMLVTIPGTADGQFLVEGRVVDINEKTATFLIEQGQAEPYPKPEPEPEPVPEPKPAPVVRTAEVTPPQNAAARTTKPAPWKGPQ